jgi:hypothetical protein
MSTPLLKSLKPSGTTFYAFPGAQEDIAVLAQNDNYKISFDKFVLLNFPPQNLTGGTANNPIYWDFDVFNKASLTSTADYSERLIESLRNYVANHEEVLKNSRINNNEYFYDNNLVSTVTEKVFWKWCRELNLVQWEKATPNDEYFDNLDEFLPKNQNDDEYFPEIIWRERDNETDWRATYFFQSVTNNLQVRYDGIPNFRAGDIVLFSDISNTGITAFNGLQLTVESAEFVSGSFSAIFDYAYVGSSYSETTGTSKLVYNRLVQYIGDITAINNVQEANKSYTEVYAHIGDQMGRTPDVLFRTKSDENYKPNLEFPILPSQIQPEILGAEDFSSPIVSDPQNYPGDYFGQFDTTDFTYKTSTGDELRRSGEYYGVSGDVNNYTLDPSNLDGVNLDFDYTHYVKMNIIGQETSLFDEFNSLPINNEPPSDFEFNAILWYYTATDVNGNTSENLYGISFLDNPARHTSESLVNIQIPPYKKLVATSTQDGISYAFSLNLNYYISSDIVQPQFNANNINSLFSFNLFNEAMKRLAFGADQMLSVIAENENLKEEIENMKSLLYSQSDLQTINAKIKNLENLLNLYKSLQLVSSDTIGVTTLTNQGQPVIQLNSRDAGYSEVNIINTSDLYSSTGIIVRNINVPDSKDFLVKVTNNDETLLTFTNNDKLTLLIDRDLDFKQSVDILIDSTDASTQNKKLDIFINYDDGTANSIPTTTLLIGDIDLPVYFNSTAQKPNSARTWNQIELDVDLTKSIILTSGNILYLPLETNIGILKGDTLLLNNFIVGVTNSVDYSGQYLVDTVATSSNYIYLDTSSNLDLVSYTGSIPYQIHISNTQTELAAIPNVSLNKGFKFKITRIDPSDNSSITDRYLINGGSN